MSICIGLFGVGSISFTQGIFSEGVQAQSEGKEGIEVKRHDSLECEFPGMCACNCLCEELMYDHLCVEEICRVAYYNVSLRRDLDQFSYLCHPEWRVCSIDALHACINPNHPSSISTSTKVSRLQLQGTATRIGRRYTYRRPSLSFPFLERSPIVLPTS